MRRAQLRHARKTALQRIQKRLRLAVRAVAQVLRLRDKAIQQGNLLRQPFRIGRRWRDFLRFPFLRAVIHILTGKERQLRRFLLALLQGEQAAAHRLKRAQHRERAGSKQLAQNHPGEMALAAWQGISIFALQKRRHILIQRKLVIARRELLRQRMAAGIAHILAHIAA